MLLFSIEPVVLQHFILLSHIVRWTWIHQNYKVLILWSAKAMLLFLLYSRYDSNYLLAKNKHFCNALQTIYIIEIGHMDQYVSVGVIHHTQSYCLTASHLIYTTCILLNTFYPNSKKNLWIDIDFLILNCQNIET